MKNCKIVILMTDENIFGRELIKLLWQSRFKIEAIIIEKGSKYAEKCKNHLKNNFYSPPFLFEIIKDRRLKVIYTENLNSNDCYHELLSLAPNFILLGGARILKDYILNTAKVGTLNCHPGLLPEYRGLDPVGWAIYNGDDIGITCHFVDQGIDTGPILIRRKEKWKIGESLLQTRVRLMRNSAKLLIEALEGLQNGSIKPKPQSGQTKFYSAMPPEVIRKVDQIFQKLNKFKVYEKTE